MPSKGTGVAVALAAVLGITGIALAARAAGRPPDAAYASPTFRRTVAARIYQVNPGTTVYSWCVPGQTAATVGTVLAPLNPGHVASLVRVEPGFEALPASVITDYLGVRSAVLAVNPKSMFDLEIRMSRYTTASGLVSALQTVLNLGFPFEAFTFSGYAAATEAMRQAAYQTSKAAGKLVGGGLPAMTSYLPDYITTEDSQFNVPSAVAGLAKTNIPVILGLANGATPVFVVNGVNVPEHDYYVQNLTTAQRQQVIQSLAAQQLANGFSFIYPVIFPEAPIGVYFWTPGDGTSPNTTYDVIKATMDALNPHI